jgi:DnaJ-class molecular chaperone
MVLETHYNVLNVSSSASYEEIKIAFHQLARSYHPDKQQQQQQQQYDSNNNNDDNPTTTTAVDRFRTIQQAWEVLRDEQRRKAYDDDLLQHDLHEKVRNNGAIEIDYDDDLVEAIDDETEERFMIYDCRCGEEVHITTNENNGIVMDNRLVDCQGCCFVYRIVKK